MKHLEAYKAYLPALLTFAGACLVAVGVAENVSPLIRDPLRLGGALMAAGGAFWAAHRQMTDTHRDTVMRLLVQVGEGCAALSNDMMRDLPCKRVQVDEIWSFVGAKEKNASPEQKAKGFGDIWGPGRPSAPIPS